MNWLKRYAQVPGAVPSAATRTPGAGGQVAPAEGGTAGMQAVFRGGDANNVVVENLLTPLDSLSQDTWSFLEKANNGNPAARFLVGLAENGQLEDFKQVVQSYVTDNIYESVATGTADGLSEFQEWIGRIEPYLAGGDPFGISDSLASAMRIVV